MKNQWKIAWVATLLFVGNTLSAQIGLPSVFTDNMVLQQQSEVPVWGWAPPASTIKVVGSWAPGDTAVTKTASNGHWKVQLKTASAGGPYTIYLMGAGTCELKNVLLGEVWLCSGQSNMEWTAGKNLVNKEAEIAAANYPNIRFFHVPRRGADYPQDDCEATWAVCTPETMSNTSAVAYFFARKLQQEMNVPVGLIVSSWGGTTAETWTEEKRIAENPTLQANVNTSVNPWWPWKPGTLYNQMIHPVIPYRLAGTLWYQGESNHGQHKTYGLLLKTMIEGWRADFGTDFPFYQVQIAPFTYNSKNNTPALLREQQEWVTANVPNTGMVVASDLVEDIKDIHPIDKQNVGLRLANMALAKTYNKEVKGYVSPTFKSVEVVKNKLIVNFLHAEEGLTCKDKKIEGLQIAGSDGVFVPASGRIKGSTLEVSSPQVKHPQTVRYCFDDATTGNLFSTSGLPVAPFRSDRGWSAKHK